MVAEVWMDVTVWTALLLTVIVVVVMELLLLFLAMSGTVVLFETVGVVLGIVVAVARMVVGKVLKSVEIEVPVFGTVGNFAAVEVGMEEEIVEAVVEVEIVVWIVVAAVGMVAVAGKSAVEAVVFVGIVVVAVEIVVVASVLFAVAVVEAEMVVELAGVAAVGLVGRAEVVCLSVEGCSWTAVAVEAVSRFLVEVEDSRFPVEVEGSRFVVEEVVVLLF
jgi:hypothetical protein